jgi:hypothetical protein
VKDACATGYSPVYIAAVKGSETLAVINTNTLEIISNANNVIMQVPEGDAITVYGLLYFNSKYYYGNATVNLKSGSVTDVVINIASTLENALNVDTDSDEVFCNSVPEVTKYIFGGDAAGDHVLDDIFYEGSETRCNKQAVYTYYGGKVIFSDFNLTCGPYY